MLIVKDCIVTEDIADRCFCCDLARCKGQCCVEGDCGAPLEESEIPILEKILPQVAPYMTPAGLEAVRRDGVSALDNAAEPCTPLVNGRECAYVAWGEDGTAYCAIEQACRDGKTDFLKPVSCHLYPLRVDCYGEFTAVNYHRWDICRCAVAEGSRCGQPLYVYLRQPLIRRFGQEWYDELLENIASRNNKDSK